MFHCKDPPRAVAAVSIGRVRQSQKSTKVLVLLVKYTIIGITKNLIKQMDDMAISEPALGEDITFDLTEPHATTYVPYQQRSSGQHQPSLSLDRVKQGNFRPSFLIIASPFPLHPNLFTTPSFKKLRVLTEERRLQSWTRFDLE